MEVTLRKATLMQLLDELRKRGCTLRLGRDGRSVTVTVCLGRR